jgi:preprotein translocase subunit SecE
MHERIAQFRAFLQDVGQEVRKISWPQPKEIAGATAVVIFTGIVVAAILFVYDLLIGQVIKVVLR